MSNGNQSNAPAVDLELRLGWGPSEAQRSPLGVHICSHCSKPFGSLQALGGHQTAHRREMEEMRRRQVANAEANGLPLALPSKESTTALRHMYMGGTRSFVGGITDHQVNLPGFRRSVEPEAISFVNLELRLGAMENEVDLTLGL